MPEPQPRLSASDSNSTHPQPLPISYSAKFQGGSIHSSRIPTSSISRPKGDEEAEKEADSKTTSNQQGTAELDRPFPDLSVSLDFLKSQAQASNSTHQSIPSSQSNGNGFGTIGTGPISASSSTTSPWGGGIVSSPGLASSNHPFSSPRPIPTHSHSHSISSNHSSSSFSSSVGGGSPSSFSESRQGRPTFTSETHRRPSLFADESDPVHLPASPQLKRDASRSREPVSRTLADHQITPSSARSTSASPWDSRDSGYQGEPLRSRSASASGGFRDAINSNSPHLNGNGIGDSASIYSTSSNSSSRSQFNSLDRLRSGNGTNGNSNSQENGNFATWNAQQAQSNFATSNWNMDQSNVNRNISSEKQAGDGIDSPDGRRGGSPTQRFTKRSQSAQPSSREPGSGLENNNPRTGDGLATMHEEWEKRESERREREGEGSDGEGEGSDHQHRDDGDDAEGGTKTARASPQQRSNKPLTSPTPRQSRSRSNSSAPALALHMSSNQPRGFTPWEEAPGGGEQSRFGYGMSGEDDRDGPTPKTPRSPSQGNRKAQPISSRGGFEDLGHRDNNAPSNSFDRALGYSNMSPFMREGGMALLNDLERHQGGGGGDGYHPNQQPYGTESRRHSIAAAPPPSHEPPPSSLNQRRAVGFEVSGNGATGSWQARASSAQPPQGQVRSHSYGLFGGGGLAISDDDLADGFGSGLQLDSQPPNPQHQNVRVPSSAAAATGAHAASMPHYFGERGPDAFGFGSGSQGDYAYGQGRSQQPIGSTASSWDMSSPISHHNDRDNAADIAGRKFRAMSMGLGEHHYDGVGSPNPVGAGSQFGGRAHQQNPYMEGERARRGRTDSVSTSSEIDRTHSPAQSSASGGGRQQLSPRAQAFAIGAPPPTARQNSQSQYAPPGRNDSPSSSYQFQHQQQQHHQRILPPHSASNPMTGFLPPPPSAELGLAGMSHHQHLSSAPLSEYAMNSLATLGPMAPLGGPNIPGGFGFGGMEPANLQDMGKGVPLQTLSRDMILYIVEFKQGRTDLYFKQTENDRGGYQDDVIRKGDLVVVEADRGKDLGTVVNDSIAVAQVQTFLAHQTELAAASSGAQVAPDGSSRLTRSINPKRLFSKASPSDTSLLYQKAHDEEKALQLCIAKVHQRGLQMRIVSCELQFDRKKLTYYYHASSRVDFRDLVKELFRLYKTRIWMCHLNLIQSAGPVG